LENYIDICIYVIKPNREEHNADAFRINQGGKDKPGQSNHHGADEASGGGAGATVYGKLFLANPDLPERFKRDAPLNKPDQATFYE
jgi:2,4-dienoyl-CoA reductase-like NADH-dependent reductase (Old Yellow Enzyme family)